MTTMSSSADLFRNRFLWILVLCASLFLLQIVAAALPAEKARGIAPEDLKHYQTNPIWCKDKSKSFPLSRLNDDYCDCPDGTDEPGTSACPEAKFYCKNTGHIPQFTFSSRVNDGICDCCDGSDEYNGLAQCPDTCWEAGKKSREKLERKVSVYKEGSRLRAKDIQYAKQTKKQNEEELITLKKEEKGLKEVSKKLKVQLEAVEEAERLEREKKAKEEEEQRAKEKANMNETIAAEMPSEQIGEKPEEIPSGQEIEPDEREVVKDKTEELAGSPSEQVSEVSEEEAPEQDEPEDPDKMQDLTKEELGRLVASRWTGEGTNTKAEETPEVSHENDDGDEHLRDHDHYHNEDDHDHLREEDDQEEEDDSTDHYGYENQNEPYEPDAIDGKSEDGTWWEKLRQASRALLKVLGLKRMQVDPSEADRIRSDYRQANNKLSEIQSRISELENKLKQDFGKDGEFFSLYEQCFERRQQKYVYKVCLYKQATQEEGHSSTRLGTWEGYEDGHKTFKFLHGDHCWNGPERSLKVRLKCGLKSELSDVEEPSRCEYSANFWTPAVCYEERAKELQAQLDALRSGAAPVHEEL